MASAMESGERWCVVTGGRGFAARHLVEMLLRFGEWRVRIADLAPAIALEPREEDGILGDALRSGNATYVSADLRDKPQVVKAFEGAEAVFHMAAPDSSINDFGLHYSVNVEGTKNVINACIECKVKRLIYTSSPSVVFDGIHGIVNGDESMSYPEMFNDSYSETKAEGEKLVMMANGRNGLLTCCIRPSSIFGPGDRLLVPSIAAHAKTWKGKIMIGNGNNFYDFTYVENVAYGHVCAERALSSEKGASKAAGKTYLITNGEPIKFWEFTSLIAEGLGYERPSIKIPYAVIMPIARMVEQIYRVFSCYGMPVPQLTPSRVRLVTCNRTFNCTKAKDHLGYEPVVSLKDGLQRTIESYPHLKAQRRSGTVPRTSLYLGDGILARTLLWKDRRETITALIFLAAIYHHFLASGYTLGTSISKLISFVALFLFIHGMLPPRIFGYNIEKLQPSHFELSEAKAHQVAHFIGSSWNSSVSILKSLCRGKDWPLFFKVIFFLSVASMVSSMSPHNAFKLGVVLFFTVFYAYERWGDAIDEFFDNLCVCTEKLREDAIRKISAQA